MSISICMPYIYIYAGCPTCSNRSQAAVLDDLADCLPLGCNVAYASNPAEAQRSGPQGGGRSEGGVRELCYI